MFTVNNWRVWLYRLNTNGMYDRFHPPSGLVLPVLVPNRNVVNVKQQLYPPVFYWVNSMLNIIEVFDLQKTLIRPYYINYLEMPCD